MMRYAALNQGIDSVANFHGFIPLGGPKFDQLAAPDKSPIRRNSDEQLYALALFIYSLQPPPKSNRGEMSVARG